MTDPTANHVPDDLISGKPSRAPKEPRPHFDPPEGEKRADRKPLRYWGARIGIGLAGCFLAFHVYALILALLPAPITLNMMGSRIVGADVRRDIVPLRDISPNLVRAVIAAEDSKFCSHYGIDFAAVQKAFENNQQGGKRRGGSTISQQTAKNIFFWNGGGYVRKAGEAWMTLVTETIWSKRRIMTHYLNVAEWGDGIYGAEAAAQIRFGKPASELSTREAALLAAVLPSPNNWRVDPPGNYVSGRAGTIQQRMRVVQSDGLDACVFGD